MILVDYRCASCVGRFEVRVDSPPPPTHVCPACRGEARRTWSPVGLGGRAQTQAASPTPPQRDPLCVRNPGVPGICHMDPAAARTMVARATGDNRGLDRELDRQEKAIGEGAVTPPGAGGHQHGHGHGHGHGASVAPSSVPAGRSHAQ